MKYLCHAICSLLFMVSIATAQVQKSALRQEIQVVSEKQESYPIPGSHLLLQEEQKILDYLKAHPEAVPKRSLQKSSAWGFQVGKSKTWWATDITSNTEYQVQSTCRVVGQNCYIFVEDSLWEVGGNGRVTQASVDSIQNAFDFQTPADSNKGIYQTDVQTFGNPPDVDSDPKIVILILNIIDGFTDTGGYVAGYFFSINEFPDGDPAIDNHRSNEAEIYYIDANPGNLTTSSGLRSAMSTTAHEFQHMIHWAYDRDEATFVNEGCSLMAEVVCGYPIYNQSRYANETNAYLFQWRGSEDANVLNDYSRAARWTLYLLEQFPNDFLKLLVAAQQNQIDGINQALTSYTPTTSRRFLDIFEDWLVANYLDDASMSPRYSYIYAPLMKAIPVRTHLDPNVSSISDTVKRLGGEYIKFVGGSDLSVRFTSSVPSLIVKAIKIGSAPVVEDVPLNTTYEVPDFGTTYSEVTFALINKNQSSDATYSYSATGTAETTVLELAYDDGGPEGYLNLSPGDSILVYFDGVEETNLDSIRIAFRRAGTIQMGVWRFTGASNQSPLGQTLVAPFDVVCSGPEPPYPYPVPYNNWVSVDLSSHNIDTSSDFAVSFLVGENPSVPAVMISIEPDEDIRHSYTYSQTHGRWVVFVPDEENVYKYLVRSYVRSTPPDSQEIVEPSPNRFQLLQNHPNPFDPTTNQTTTIRYDLPKTCKVVLKIYNLLGQEIKAFVNENEAAGYNKEVIWDGRNDNGIEVSSGVYIYRLQTPEFRETKKLLLIR